jgi:hypothetical protein
MKMRLAVGSALLSGMAVLVWILVKRRKESSQKLNVEKVETLDEKGVISWFKNNTKVYQGKPQIVHLLIYPEVAEQKLNIKINLPEIIKDSAIPNIGSERILFQALYNQKKEMIEKGRLIAYDKISDAFSEFLHGTNFFSEGIILLEDSVDHEVEVL